MPLKKAARPGAIPPVLDSAYAYRGDWDFGKKGDSSLVMLHAFARALDSCGAARCPGNQVVELKKNAKAFVVRPDGTTYVFLLNKAPNTKAPSDLSYEQVARLRSDLGATTLSITACNPRTWYDKPYGVYKDRVVATFDFVKVVAPTMSM